jgi:para-nitrobenzyl esterase
MKATPVRMGAPLIADSHFNINGLDGRRQMFHAYGGTERDLTFHWFPILTMSAVLVRLPVLRPPDGLYHRVIAESGSAPWAQGSGLWPAPSLADAEKVGRSFAEKLGAPENEALAYLRGLSADDILTRGGSFANSGDDTAVPIDGWVLPAAPGDTLTHGKANRVPLLVSTCAIEFPADGGPAEWRRSLSERFGALAPRALALYGLADNGGGLADDPLYGTTADQVLTDMGRGAAVVQAEGHGAAGNGVWLCEFDRAIPPRAHVGHSSDLPYVFGNLLPSGGQGGAFEATDRQMSELVQRYWTAFARTGNPNGPATPPWRMYDAKNRYYQAFTTAGTVQGRQDLRGPYLDLYRALLVPTSAK